MFLDEMKNVSESFNFLYTGHWLQGKLGEDRKDIVCYLKFSWKHLKIQKTHQV